jgi:uncharacterized membrane protein
VESLLVLVGLAFLAMPVLVVFALLSVRDLRRRVASLEGDLEALLSQRVAAPPPAPAPASVPVPPRAEAPPRAEPPAPATPTAAPPRIPTPERAPRGPDKVDVVVNAIKRWFTVGNVPVKIGMLVLFAGVAALLKFASDQGWLNAPIELRLAGIAAAALAALVFAWRQRLHNRVFALSLQGGAIGILLMTVFAAFKLYALLPAGAAFALSVVLIAGAGVLAVLQDAKALAFFAVLAGFLAPLWLSTGSGNHVALFSYYAILNVAIFAIAWWKAWRILNLLGFVFTFGIGTAWGVLQYDPSKFASTEPFLVLFFALYLAIPLLFARRRPETRRDAIDGCLVFGTPLVAFALQAGLLRGERMPLAFCALGLGALYAALGWALRRRGGYRLLTDAYVLLAAGFATLAVPLALSARATASVFALEGAGLVWLGVRRGRRWPEATGIALQLIAAMAYLATSHSRTWTIETPIANPLFMSALIVCLGAFASAWAYRTGDRARSAAVAYLWGLAWWVGNGGAEIIARVVVDARADAMLAFFAFTGWLAAEVHRRRPATALAGTTLATLVSAVPLAILQVFAHDQPFAGHGAWAWMVFAVLGVRSLVCLRAGEHRLAGPAQFTWWLVWPFAASLALAWVCEHVRLADGWVVAGAALPWLAVAAVALFRWPWLRAPLQERFDPLRGAFLSTLFAIVGLGWIASLFEAGDSAPLPWIPVANPLEIVQLAALVLAARWLWSPHAPVRLARNVAAPAAFAFAWLTSVVLRGVHHWGHVPWDGALLGTSLAQTSLTVAWSILGVVAWVVGSRRGHRSLWLAGAVLMGVVLAKLIVVDRGNLGNALGIASFIAFGVLCTVVGYLAPAPPRAPDLDATA